jgi:DNA polymerase-1
MTNIILPNVRKLFVPDRDHVMFEADLKGADAQVVAWEAEDDDLKNAFRSGIDVHAKNAEDMLGSTFTRLTGHLRDAKRQENKKAVHATNYGAMARTLAVTLGWTVHDSDRFQHRWFALHPGIRNNFHRKVRDALTKSRTITNRFGFRRVFFDRIESSFAEALAWIPQSTVALATYQGAFQLEDAYFPDPSSKEGMLLQTHDSINFQFHITNVPPIEYLHHTLAVKIPYDDPLIIPWDIKKSLKSWGDMEKAA